MKAWRNQLISGLDPFYLVELRLAAANIDTLHALHTEYTRQQLADLLIIINT